LRGRPTTSWERWVDLFERNGFVALTPGWPGDADTVEQANEHPDAVANTSVGEVADHFEAVISRLVHKPAVVGHSFVPPSARWSSGAAGVIVNVASVNSFFHPDGLVIDYGAAKAALLNVAKALSQELGPRGIRVNSVSPGPVATDLWLGEHGVAATIASASGVDADAVRNEAIASMPTGRFTTPEEVATLVVMLASPLTGNVTGSNYVIDGGLVKTM
jgi:NAD(P)-dependent dehydrogenase (short-subunit alcohol dehydrogenase family)